MCFLLLKCLCARGELNRGLAPQDDERPLTVMRGTCQVTIPFILIGDPSGEQYDTNQTMDSVLLDTVLAITFQCR